VVKRRIKIRPILVTLNLIVLLLIVGFYVRRLIKCYLDENGGTEDGPVMLVDVLLKKQKYVDLTEGLVFNKEDKVYRYIGNVDDNYLEYSGSLYRIIEIDSFKNIKAVSDKSFTNIYGNLSNGYKDSYINKWLNISEADGSGIFEKNLYNPDLLFYTTMCDDVITDLTNITCDNKSSDYRIGILSLYDYAKSGGKSGYLNNGESFYLNTLDDNKGYYYITPEGEVSIGELATKTYGVRPVLTFNGDVDLIDGKGTIDEPYIIETHEIKTLKDLYVGNIIEFSENKFIVLDVSKNDIKVASVESLKDKEGNEILINFGSSSSAYSNSSNTVGNYLNNTYYNSLENNDLIVNSDWYIGKLSIVDLDYMSVKSSKVQLKIGMLTLGDMYISNVKNVFTILRGFEENKIINIINEDGNFYGDFVNKKYGIRPAFYLKGDTIIEGGKGTLEEPYKLGVKKDEENENSEGE